MPGVADRTFSVRTLLIGFAVAIAGPLLVLLAVLLYRSVATERSELEGRLLQVANNLAELIDRDIDRSVALLQTLATSPAVTAEDWPRFYNQAKAALGERAYLVLIDKTGRQVVNTYVPQGSEPPFTGDPETLKRMLASRVPVVSDLFTSLVVKGPVYNISIPVLRGQTVRYVMSLGLLPKDLAQVLQNLKLNPAWVTTIWDRNNVVLARSRDHERFVGTMLPSGLRQQQPNRAVLKISNLDREQMLLAVTTSKLSEWRISVSVPVGVAEAPLRRSVWIWAGATLVTVAAASILGLLIGRLLESSFISLVAVARAPPSDKTAPDQPSKVTEANEVVRVLVNAGQRQAILMREIAHRVKNTLAVVHALASRSLSDGRTLAEARSLFTERLLALGRAHDALFRVDWSGVPLQDIVAGEIEAFLDRVNISGPPLIVMPGTVQAFTLVLHELVTNAIKHGALSAPAGRIAITWWVENEESDRLLRFEWKEMGGPTVAPPVGQGFGSKLLQQGVTSGDPELLYEPSGFIYRMMVPLTEIGHIAP